MANPNVNFMNYLDNAEYPNLLRRGILRMNDVDKEGNKFKRPIYIVEILEEERQQRFVTVYEPHSLEEPETKRYIERLVPTDFSGETILAQIARKMNPNKKEKLERVERPPIFIAPIMDGVDTFTGVADKGFWEREPDDLTIENNKSKVTQGKLTKVFIGLSSITWNEPVVPTRELLLRTKAYQNMWWDL